MKRQLNTPARRCAYCGQPIQPRLPANWYYVEPTTYETSLGWPKQFANENGSSGPSGKYTEATRRKPTRDPNIASDVAVPAGQTLITALVVLVFTTPISIWMQWPWYGPFIVAALAFGVAWLIFVVIQNETLYTVETIINEDLDGDGQVGPPPQLPAPHVTVELSDGRSKYFDELPGQLAELQYFAAGILDRRWSFSERGAAESGYGAAQFKGLREVFLARQWAMWNNPAYPQQGVALNRKGQAIISQLAATPPTPSAA